MANPVNLLINIAEGNTSGLSSINKASAGLKSLSGQAAKSSFSFGGLASSLGKTLGPLAIAAVGVGSIGAALNRAITSASEYESRLNSLNNALAQNGNFSAKASKDLEEFAGEIQRTTKFSDGAVLSSSALLGTLTKLDAQGIRKATQASLNLSSAIGIDLQSATQLVAKSIEGQVGALGRYGIKIDKAKTSSEQFANVLEALEKFQGRAVAEANTFGGALQKLKNNSDDIFKTFGLGIISSGELVQVINQISSAAASLASTFVKNSEVIGLSISALIRLFKILGQSFKVFFDFVIIGAKSISTAILGLLAAIEKSINYLDRLQAKISGKTFVQSDFWTSKFNESLDSTTDSIDNLGKDLDKFVDLATKPLALNVKPLEPKNLLPSSESLEKEAKKLAKAVESTLFADIAKGVSFVTQGREGGKAFVAEVGAKFADAIIPGSGQIVGPILKAMADGALAFGDMLTGFIDGIIDAVIGIADVFINIGDILEKAFDRIIERLPELIQKLTGLLIKAMPQIVNSLSFYLIRNMPEIISAMVKGFSEGIKDIFKDLGKSVGNIFGGGSSGGGISGTIKSIGKKLGFATGGVIPNGFPNDSYPALLSSGERVLTPSQNRMYERGEAGTRDDSILEALLNELRNLNQTQVIRSEVRLNNKAFADIILELNRNNARLA
jgi:hypothetical protein